MPDTVLSSGSTEPASSSSESSSSSSSPSTSEIAASVIADMDADTGGEAKPVTAATTTDSAAEKVAKEAVDPDDFDAVPAEITDSLNRKRPNAIPHPRVKQMIEKREKKLIATVAKELGITKAEAELQLDDVLGGVKERGTRITEFEGRIQQITAVEEVMAKNPKRFVQMLVQLNPEYADYIKQEGQAATGAAVPADDPEPEPDYDLGNNQKTYSLDGLRKLRAWERRQAVKEIKGELEPQLQPLRDRIKADQDR